MVGIVELEVPLPDKSIVDSKGYALKVALYPNMFSNGLRLNFYHPICDVLDFLSLALAQIHPNVWRILVSCSVIWWSVLEEVGFEHLELTTCKFLIIHKFLKQSGNTGSFCSIKVLARLEPQYNRVKG